MTPTAPHWAAELIGKPWRSRASGPHAFDCWGLVRHVLRLRHGLEVPDVLGGLSDAAIDVASAIKRHAQAGGWHRMPEPMADGDVVLMQGPRGRHVGIAVRADGRLHVLHADGHDTPRGPVGCVVAQSLADAVAGGYHSFELWRRA